MSLKSLLLLLVYRGYFEQIESSSSSESLTLRQQNTSAENDMSGESCGMKRKRNSYADSPHKLRCPYCPRAFPWISSLKRHILTHTGMYICVYAVWYVCVLFMNFLVFLSYSFGDLTLLVGRQAKGHLWPVKNHTPAVVKGFTLEDQQRTSLTGLTCSIPWKSSSSSSYCFCQLHYAI